jgi:uncharacterized protein (TIGR03067 family)
LIEPREALLRTSTFKLTAAQPARIDLTTVFEGSQERWQTEGIYVLQGDVLTYCIARPGQPRPTTFDTKKGEGHTLVVLKRASLEGS